MPHILFIINGLGMGNSTRCHAIIQELQVSRNSSAAYSVIKKNAASSEGRAINQDQFYITKDPAKLTEVRRGSSPKEVPEFTIAEVEESFKNIIHRLGGDTTEITNNVWRKFASHVNDTINKSTGHAFHISNNTFKTLAGMVNTDLRVTEYNNRTGG